jgi:hypothetical protein
MLLTSLQGLGGKRTSITTLTTIGRPPHEPGSPLCERDRHATVPVAITKVTPETALAASGAPLNPALFFIRIVDSITLGSFVPSFLFALTMFFPGKGDRKPTIPR